MRYDSGFGCRALQPLQRTCFFWHYAKSCAFHCGTKVFVLKISLIGLRFYLDEARVSLTITASRIITRKLVCITGRWRQELEATVIEFHINGRRKLLQQDFPRTQSMIGKRRAAISKVNSHYSSGGVLHGPRRKHSCRKSDAHTNVHGHNARKALGCAQTWYAKHGNVLL